MIYLKLRRNQDQEWSPVTISRLAKMLVGVNNIVVENLDFFSDNNKLKHPTPEIASNSDKH